MTAIPFDIQGHRGARGLLPENTLPAYLKALDLGVTTLEMDVVITRDHQVVCSHEPWMSGLLCTDPSGVPLPEAEQQQHRLYSMPYAEVARYDCGLRPHPRFPRQQRLPAVKPLLRDVLRAAEAHAAATGRAAPCYNIETKSRWDWEGHFHPDPETFTRLLWGVVEAAGVAARTTLQSFDVRTLRVGRRLSPDWRLSLLVAADGEDAAGEQPAYDPRNLDARFAALGFVPHLYSPEAVLVDAALVAAARAHGVAVLPWTVNDADTMGQLQRLGVAGLITDYPDVAIRVLRP